MVGKRTAAIAARRAELEGRKATLTEAEEQLRLRQVLLENLKRANAEEEAKVRAEETILEETHRNARRIFANLAEEPNSNEACVWFFSRMKGERTAGRAPYCSPQSAFGDVAIKVIGEMLFEEVGKPILEKVDPSEKQVFLCNGEPLVLRGRRVGRFFLLVATRDDGAKVPLAIEEEYIDAEGKRAHVKMYPVNLTSRAVVDFLARKAREKEAALTETVSVGSPTMIGFEPARESNPAETTAPTEDEASVLAKANEQKA